MINFVSNISRNNNKGQRDAKHLNGMFQNININTPEPEPQGKKLNKNVKANGKTTV